MSNLQATQSTTSPSTRVCKFRHASATTYSRFYALLELSKLCGALVLLQRVDIGNQTLTVRDRLSTTERSTLPSISQKHEFDWLQKCHKPRCGTAEIHF
jgi:hypothetical protein